MALKKVTLDLSVGEVQSLLLALGNEEHRRFENGLSGSKRIHALTDKIYRAMGVKI
jgi:hypothetical protein